MIVRLKKSSRVKNSAETVFQAVEAAKDDEGNIDLQSIVDAAKPKNAPLHGEFTWEQRTAANKWRLHEARRVVQSIEVVHEESPATRAWESVTVVEKNADPEDAPKGKRVFRSVEDIMADPAQRDELLVQALRDAAAWRKRYAGLQELAQVFQAIDETILKTRVA